MTTQTVRLLSLVFIICAILNSVQSSNVNTKEDTKFELYDGVTLEMPANDTKKIISLEINMNKNGETGRAKTKKLINKFMPMFILPFVIQSTLVPLFLGLLKFMLFKSLMIGKLALVLIIINAFRNSNSFKGRMDEEIANFNYGYHGNGNEEYGSFINK